MDALNPFKLVELVFQLIDKYIPSPEKEVILAAFGAALLGGMIYGMFFRGFRPAARDRRSEDDDEGKREERSGSPLREQLLEAREQIRSLENRLTISAIERYYLYFNGIANASLMLGFAILVDRRWSPSKRDALPIKEQIGSFISILLVGLVTSILLNALVDILAAAPTRRTDVINRAFLIAFAINALVFVAYHLNYINL
jgi:hypothetical protein